MRTLHVILGLALGSLLIFGVPFLVCVFRTYTYFRKPVAVEICEEAKNHVRIEYNEAIIQRFSEALRFKTVTSGKGKYNKEELTGLIDFIKQKFPNIHSSKFVTLERLAGYTLLYTIKGKKSQLRPYFLSSHLDVVPAEPSKWKEDPFAGVVKDGYIIGRGALDVKDTLMGSLEALEFLLSQKYEFQRTFYMAFGHDEEGTGFEGARTIAETLHSRGVKLEYILDEGTTIISNMFPGVKQPVALIAVSEKGFTTLKLQVTGEPGHSSMPKGETTIVTLSKAVSKLDSTALPSRFGLGPEKSLFESLAPYAPFPYNVVFSNLWLFGPFVSDYISQTGPGNALVRTTTAATVINGGVKENVLPSSCYALINHRIHPSDSVSKVIELDRNIIADDRVAVSVHAGTAFEPHPVSPHGENVFGFQTIGQSVRAVFPDAIVAPSVMLASTDSKWYLNLTSNIYRFSPAMLTPGELTMFHGHNEKISVDNYMKVINFYHHLMLLSDREALREKPEKDEL